MTLAETLLAVLILVMVSGIVATGIPAAKNAYEKVVLSANAEMLLSTTVTALRSELDTAQNISISSDGKSISYYDVDDGLLYKLELSTNDGSGNVPIGIYKNLPNNTEGDTRVRLISESSSTAASKGDLYVVFEEVSFGNGGNDKKSIIFEDLKVMHGSETITTPLDITIRALAN